MVGLFKPSLTLGASKFWNSNPRVQNMRTEWKTTKYQQSENNEKKWNQVLKLASKTRKAKSQMDPFQNLGSYETKFWNWHLRQGRPSLRWIHFKTRENHETKFWNWHLRQGRPSLRWIHFKTREKHETKSWNWHLRQGRPNLRWIHFKTWENHETQLWNWHLRQGRPSLRWIHKKQVLKLASKTRKTKSQMDPLQNHGNYESKFWDGHPRQGRPSPR